MIRESRQQFHLQWEAKRRRRPGRGRRRTHLLYVKKFLCRGRKASRGGPLPASTAWPLPALAAAGEGAPGAGDLQSCAAPRSFPGRLLPSVAEAGRTRTVGSEPLREGTWGPGVRVSLEARGVGGSGQGCGAKDRGLVICQGAFWLPSIQCHEHHRGKSKTAQGQLQTSSGVRNEVLGAPYTDRERERERGGLPHPCQVCLG